MIIERSKQTDTPRRNRQRGWARPAKFDSRKAAMAYEGTFQPDGFGSPAKGRGGYGGGGRGGRGGGGAGGFDGSSPNKGGGGGKVGGAGEATA